MKRKLLYTLMFSSIIVLTACGGGGGGGGGSGGSGGSGSPYPSGNPYLRTEVPFATPTRVATVDPLVNSSSKYFVGDTYSASISGSGQDLIIAGFESQPTASANHSNSRISMLSWQNGQLIDKTAQWFPNDTNVILGTNGVKFADFFNTGRTGMLVAPYTDDYTLTGPAYVYTNNGTSFSRQTIALNNVHSHDSAIYDLNRDGYQDLIILDTGSNTTLAINDRVSSFRTYTAASGPRPSGSGVAVADFLGNGTSTLLVTDSGQAGAIKQSTKLWGYSINGADQLTFNEIAVLPTPRFELPKWAAYGITTSHNVRALAFDFDNSGKTSAVIFSQPGTVAPGVNTNYSEIQFLKNQGGGVFTDVTDTTLVGYNTATRVSYNPKLMDINGDGLIDILVSSTSSDSTQFLLQSADHKYVAAYQKVMNDFLTQSAGLAGSTSNNNSVNVVKGPDGKMYLVTAVSYMNGSDRQLAVYASVLGSQSTTSAQSAVNLIKQTWPYMTDVQANQALAKTSATYINGIAVIDDQSILQPLGDVGLPVAGRGLQPIRGYLAGVTLDNGMALVQDSTGRSWATNLKSMNVQGLNSFGYNTEHIDQHNLTSHAEYLINGQVNTYNGMRMGSEGRNAGNTFSGNGQDLGPSLLQKPTQYTFGIPEIYRNGNFSYGTQYTSLNSNPFIGFGGAWGTINSTGVMDNVATYRNNGFSAQGSVMHVSTNIQPGLVTRVNNMVGAWGETGYRYTEDRFGDLGFYAGIKPVVLTGNVEAKLPTGIDNAGNTVYTKKTMAVQNQTVGYVRALYTNQLDKKTQYRFSAMTTQQGQYRLMHELRFWLD